MFTKSIGSLLMICGLVAVSFANSVSTDQEECPQICPALYSPLCATNGKVYKEFSNACELKASNCRLERSALESKFLFFQILNLEYVILILFLIYRIRVR